MITLDVKFRFPDLAKLRRMPGRIDWAKRRIVARAAQQAARDMKLEAPKASSVLTNSIKADKLSDDSYVVRPHVNYAEYALHGRRPGRPPPWQPIYDWVKVKGIGGDDPEGTAWAVRRHIALHGTRGHDYITPVYDQLVKDLPAITQRIIQQALRR